jgi:hypothetical protein
MKEAAESGPVTCVRPIAAQLNERVILTARCRRDDDLKLRQRSHPRPNFPEKTPAPTTSQNWV